MTSHGPDTGLRSRVMALRAKRAKLELADYPGVLATPETVARLCAAKVLLELDGFDSVRLNLGDGVKEYAIGDVETLLASCAVAFAEHDAVQG